MNKEKPGKILEENAPVNPLDVQILRDYNNTRDSGPKPVLCYAPFKNLYFGREGKIVSCCSNRDYVLGTYPQQSIKEIWFGKQTEQLRQFIMHNDLSLGCQNCRNELVSGNFDAAKSKMYDVNRENENKYPSVFEMELNNACNLECVMCNGNLSSSIRKNREKLPPVKEMYDDRFLNQIEEFIPYLEEIKFFGGEPFLIDIYYRIWDIISRINPQCRISVQTNGTILNNRVRGLLEKCNFHITVSIESLEKKNYENIRVNGNFDTVMDNILHFREYTRAKNTFFGISVCAIRQNSHEIPAFVDFCNRLGAPLYIHTVWRPLHCSLWNLDSEGLEKIINHLKLFSAPQSNGEKTRPKADPPLAEKNARHFNDFVKQMESWLERRIKEYNAITPGKTKNERIYMEALCDKIKQYIRNLPGLTDLEKETKENQSVKKAREIIGQIPNVHLREKILKNSNKFGIEVIVSGLESASPEQILNKALAFGDSLFFE